MWWATREDIPGFSAKNWSIRSWYPARITTSRSRSFSIAWSRISIASTPIVAFVLGTVQVVRLVDEQHAAVRALEHLLGLRRGVADVLADEVVADVTDDVVARD